MRSHTVVPNNHRVLLPLQASLEIRAQSDVLVQEIEQVVRLLLLEAHDASSELRVDEQRFLASHGVSPDDWVNTRDGFATDDATASQSSVRLLVRRVHRREDACETLATDAGMRPPNWRRVCRLLR
jgi:hypothetical protein